MYAQQIYALRKWAPQQKRFGVGAWFDTAVPEPVEVYEEDGVLIKRYSAGYARGISSQRSVR